MTDRALNCDADMARRAMLEADEAFRKAHGAWMHGAEGAPLAGAWKLAEAAADELAGRCRDCARDAGWRPGDDWGVAR